MMSTPLHRGRQDLVVYQSCGDMRAAAVFRGRRNCRGVHSAPPRGIGLGVDQSCGDMRAVAVFRVDAIVKDLVYINWGDMHAAAVFRVDAIVKVSTPLHRGRQDSL
ncbi:hypothetical protein GQ457_04G017180 [Hibiscus cannabinus]